MVFSMSTTNPKVHDLTSNRLGIAAAKDLQAGSVVVVTIFLNGRNNEYGVYVLGPDKHDRYDLRASCMDKADALLLAEYLAEVLAR